MKKTSIIIVFIHSLFLADEVLIKLKDGMNIQGDFLGVFNESVYCRPTT